MRSRTAALTIVAVSVIGFRSGRSNAKDKPLNNVFTIQLRSDIAERPRHLCVIFDGHVDSAAGQSFQSVSDLWMDTSSKIPRFKSGQPDCETRCANAASKNVCNAFCELSRRTSGSEGAGAQACDNPKRCQPAFTLAPKNLAMGTLTTVSVACAENSEPESVASSSVLIVNLGRDQTIAGATLQDIRLEGTVAYLTMCKKDRERCAPLSPSHLTVSVVGGDFQGRGSVSNNDRNQFNLPIEPLCLTRLLKVPFGVGSKVDVTMSGAGTDGKDSYCRSPVIRPGITLALPIGNPGGLKVLRSSISACPADTECGQKNVIEFDWTSNAPSELESPVAKRVSFAWTRSCYLKRGDCPKTRVAALNKECPGKYDPSTDTCGYTCDVEDSALSVSLPTSILMSVGTAEDAWTETLSYAGQVFSGYSGRETRQFELDLSAWRSPGEDSGSPPPSPDGTAHRLARADRPGDRIDTIEVAAPSGALYRLRPLDGGQRISVPGAACNDNLQYRIVGARPYREESVPVINGRISIPSPDDTARWFRPSLLVGGGFLTSPISESWIVWPYPVIEATFQYHHLGTEPTPLHINTLELGLTYILSARRFYPVQADDALTGTGGSWTYYNRFIAGVSAFHDMRAWQFGGGLGVGLGCGFYRTDAARVGECTFSWFPRFTVRYSYEALSPELNIRAATSDPWLLPGERLFEFKPDNLKGDPVPVARGAFPLTVFVDLGIRIM
jgi:hypothetical protein